MATTETISAEPVAKNGRDVFFALGIVVILAVLFLPIPAFLIDIGLAFSIALSVLILMVALWIQRPLDFSAFPTVLLIATMLRLSLNIATTRLILSHGNEGTHAAGYVIGGFSQLVMSGDFVIGLIVFIILVTVNFLVITKGATRIAEVGARFTLDAIPGKQMAIDADLSAGLIDDKKAQRRRRELEEESSFFGSMDGASKFVRGDAIAGLIITAVNIFGGIIIGYFRHGMDAGRSRRRLHQAVGRRRPRHPDPGAHRLARRRPAGLQGRHARLGRQGRVRPARRPSARALRRGALLLFLGADAGPADVPLRRPRRRHGRVGYIIPLQHDRRVAAADAVKKQAAADKADEEKNSVKASLETAEIELLLGKQLVDQAPRRASGTRLPHVGKMRKKFATQYGFVVPEIKLSDDFAIPSKSYQIKIHGTVVAEHAMRVGEVMVLLGNRAAPDMPGEEVREPAFGMRAWSVPEMFAEDLKREQYTFADNMSVLLTHLSEVIRNNLPQLLSYKDMRALLDRLDPEYKQARRRNLHRRTSPIPACRRC